MTSGIVAASCARVNRKISVPGLGRPSAQKYYGSAVNNTAAEWSVSVTDETAL